MTAATAITFTVERAGAFANILAVPGALHLFRAAQERISRSAVMPLRALGTTLVVLVLMPMTPPLLSLLAPRAEEVISVSTARDAATDRCLSHDNLARLDALPPATIMAQINTAPNLITDTHHRVIGSGYHRNNRAIGDVLLFFMAPEKVAHAVAVRRHLDFVFLCQSEIELDPERDESPDGVLARLVAGTPPRWLRPVALPGLTQGKLYAVVP